MSKILSLVYANHGLIKIYQPTNSGKILFPVLRRCYSDDKSDDGNDPKDKAKAKLNSLLQDLKVSGALNIESNVDGKLAKPKFSKPVKRDKAGKLVSPLPSARDLDNDIVTATKDVAKLSSNKVKVESDLLRRLNRVAKDTKNAKNENEVSGESLESVMADIKIERPVGGSKKKQAAVLEKAAERQQLTMEQMAFLQKRAKLRRADAAQKQSSAPVDLHGGIPVGIFSGPMSQSADSDMITTWRACNKRELEVLSTPPPRNALEEMILQTKQGKLWQFPIDNEQGLDYSEDQFFNHVFLEHHLEPWCPRSGPVRTFMETVCLGLSQNPYMASEKKKDTILWFKDYFERPENREILVHSGYWEDSDSAESASN